MNRCFQFGCCKTVQDQSKAIEDGPKKGADDDKKVAFYKLFTFADKFDVVLMIVGTICAIVNGISQPLSIVIFAQIYNSFGTAKPSKIVHAMSKLSLLILYLAICAGIASFLQVSCWMISGERQATRIRCLYMKSILRQDIGFFDTEVKTGELIESMSGDTVLLQDALSDKVGKFIQQLATFFGGCIIAFVKGWQLAIVVLFSIPTFILVGQGMNIIISKIAASMQVAFSEVGNVVEQTIGAIRTVASFTGEKNAVAKYNDKLKNARRASVKLSLILGCGIGSLIFVTFAFYGLAIWYGSLLILNNSYNGGEVISVLMALMLSGTVVRQTSSGLNAFVLGQRAVYKMFKAIEREPKINSYSTSGIVLEDVNGAIELKDVYFRYPSRPDVLILSGFSLQVPDSKTVALVGQSGSGKSTVISLIERFYDPDSGEILIDGVNLKQLNLCLIREKIGLVNQEPVLFATTIKENIAYGKENATDKEIRAAINLANAAKFIDQLPKGLDTLVGERGARLSGGQKQRIAIARAILKNPRILLLDEATSALDAESEHIVQDALVKAMCNRTTIVVAHRLTTIRNADMIVVIRKGKIIEKGTHEELTKNQEGAYSQLVHLQLATKSDESRVSKKDILENNLEIDEFISGADRQRQSENIQPSMLNNSDGNVAASSIDFPENVEHEQKDKKSDKPKSFSIIRLASYLSRTEWVLLFLGAIAAILYGVVFPVFGFLFSEAVESFYQPPAKMKADSKFWAAWMVGMGVMLFLVALVQKFLLGIVGGRIIEKICCRTFEKVVHQEICWFDDPKNSSGAVSSRLSLGARLFSIGNNVAEVFQTLSTLTTGLIIAFSANWILACVLLVVSPMLLIQERVESKYIQGFNRNAKAMYEEASQVAAEAIGSIRTVVSFGAEKKIINSYESKCKGSLKQGIRVGLVSGFNFGLSLFAMFCAESLSLLIGSILVHHNKASYGDVFTVYIVLTTTASIISQSSSNTVNTAQAKVSIASMFSILDKKSRIDSSSDEGITLPHVNGNIEFEHVSFKYPTRPDVNIFNDLFLSIPSGKVVALTGESGSGKSTIISLLQRLYDPNSGSIYLDGVEIKKLKLKWLRQQMGLVSQEPVLFSETICKNITYGIDGDATEDEMIAAAKVANAHDFISSLPDGYNTYVGDRGVQLSGGQKQRVAIARAILKNPRILLLDEATSALDAESENAVQDALQKIMLNRTTIVVAHRLTTIRNADIIVVVKNGAVVEKGSHDELMEITNGAYASLVSFQKNAAQGENHT